ncbi:hypothetical protein B0H10DRAFT_2226079 [Mycena sp. CBHHK59/15]|nr:hypothetical protein B0H10DRAFT_2226079 [Mycena sp. CBHHK59/15]
MATPPEVSAWLDANYPCPRVDPEWLDACYAWITTQHHLAPATDLPAILTHVEAQLLQSDLCDSMSHGTGIPLALLHAPSATLAGPVLVEIATVTDVGVSALSLDQVRVARAERLAAGAAAGDAETEVDLEVDGEGPVPNYPRSMLRFELSDGATMLPAIEYRPLPELTLGVTPLGYKMILKDVLIRRGMAFLEPRCVTMKGYQTEDREALQESDFARGLRFRLGRPEPEPQPAAVQVQPPPEPPLPDVRSPLREISPPPSPTLPVESHHHSDDEDQPRRRRIPNNHAVPPPPSTASSSSTLVTSSYFLSSAVAHSAPRPGDMGLVLSPARVDPIEIDSDSEDERAPRVRPAPRPIIPLKGSRKKVTPPPPKNEPPSDDFDMDDMEMDPEFLEELARAEAQHIAPAPGPSPVSTRTTTSTATTGRMQVDPDADVITIDDDEEMEDKENVPAPQRHVRRRVFGGGQAAGEVINISDSD